MQKLSEKLNDPRIAKLPSQANCWSGGPSIYTVLNDAMAKAGFSRGEYRIGDGFTDGAARDGETLVLSGYVRYSDNHQWNVFLK